MIVRKLRNIVKALTFLLEVLILLFIMVSHVVAQGGSVIIYPSDDTYVSIWDDADSIHGTETWLKVAYSYAGDVIQYWTYLKFDLSSVPQGARGFTSVLELYTRSDGVSGEDTYPAYLCLNNSWTEETLNMNHLPSLGDLYLDSETVSTEQTWHAWIVSAAIENATSRNASAVTIMVGRPFGMATEGAVWAFFNSKEAVKYIPRLNIGWTEVPEFPSFVITPLFMIATLLVAIFYKRKQAKQCLI